MGVHPRTQIRSILEDIDAAAAKAEREAGRRKTTEGATT
jgi:hypothetical protein